jgi:arylsulfatase A-like enzyme
MTDLITERSVRYIREHADGPFFLSIQYNAAHWPYQSPDVPSVAVGDAAHLLPQDLDTSMRTDYGAILERADQGIGAVLQALEDAGISEDTLVIFTNDNGGEWLSRNAPLFHRKGSVWEGGIRVPAVMRWPGVIPAGMVTPQVGITMDFTATILAVAGAALPQAYEPEGIDLLPIVSGEADVLERTLFWRNRSSRAVRSGDLKLIVASPRTSFIFDVRKDPGERNDLTNVLQTDVRRMYGLLDAWVEDVDAEYETRNPLASAP